jgi:hypothetical protein
MVRIETGESMNAFELFTWKRADVVGGARYWCNVYPFVAPVEFTPGGAYAAWHNAILGEKELSLNTTTFLGGVCHKLDPLGASRNVGDFWARESYDTGQRSAAVDGAPLEFKWATRLVKEPATGGRANLVLRNTLAAANVVPYRESDWALKNAEPFGEHRTALALYHLQEMPWHHAIFTRHDEDAYPLSARRVQRIRVSGAIKLESIEAAFNRRTYAARPYYDRQFVMLEAVFMGIKTLRELLEASPWGVDPENVTRVLSAIAPIEDGAKFMLDYFDPKKGKQPEPSFLWRLNSSHDPLEMQAQAYIGDVKNAAGELSTELSFLAASPEESIPRSSFDKSEKMLNRLALLISKINVGRFPGVPVRIPRVR